MIYRTNSFRIVFILNLILCSFGCKMNLTDRAFKAGDLILGGLFPVHSYCSNCCKGQCGDLRSPDALYFAEAMMYAIDETNRNSSILQGISLGFEIFDYCSKDVIALEKASNFLPSCWKKPSSPVVGVVGPYSSSVALQVSNLLGLFKVPHVSYGATSPLLSDKSRFKYFIRTVPSDAVRAQALVDLLLKNETKYVSVLYSDDEFGREGKKRFTQAAKERGICIGITRALPQGHTVLTFDDIIMDMSHEKINAQVIVLFCSKSDISLLFTSVKKFGKERFFRWLVGGDYAEMSVYLNGNEDFAKNIVLCSPRNENSARFMEWRNRNNVSHSPWFSEIELKYETSKYRPENEGKTISADLYIQSVINSVYAFAHALDKMCKTYCVNNSNAATCLKEKSLNQTLLLDYILNVNYTTLNGRKIKFDKNGDLSAEYDILRPKKEGSSWGVEKFGRWGPPIKGAGPVKVQLFEDALILPRTFCSRPCDVGERKITIETCCWRCEPCKTDEITSSNQTECTPCTPDFMPDEKRVNCLPKPVINVDPSSSLLLFTLSLSATGILCTLFMLGVFVILKHHPVIKASSRGLSYILLVGIMISYAESFVDLMEPHKRVCSLRGYTCLGHVTCYAVMTSKVLRVNRLFNSSLRKTLNPTFVSTRSQLGFIGFILGIALLFSTIWGFFTYQDSVLRIYSAKEVIVQCNISNPHVVVTNSFYLSLLALCGVYTFKTRKLPKQFKETKSLGLAIYTAATLHLIVLSVVCTMNSQNLIRGRVVRLSHPLAASAVLFPLFSAKLYTIIFRAEKMVKQLPKRKPRAGDIPQRYANSSLLLRMNQSTPDLLRRRPENVFNLHLGSFPEDVRSYAGSLATVSDDARSRATSIDTLRSNSGWLDRCLTLGEVTRRGDRDSQLKNEKNYDHSFYSTWLVINYLCQ